MAKANGSNGKLKIAFTPEQKSALKAAGFDWSKLLQLLQNPMVKHIIIQLIDVLLTPSPQPDTPVFATTSTPKGHGDHKELCLKTLQSALCTACCAAKHYEACCQAHDESE